MASILAAARTWWVDLKQILLENKRPRIPYIALSCFQVCVGIVEIVLGAASATTTPQYPMGAFWAGLFVMALGLYRLFVALLRMLGVRMIERHKRKLTGATTAVSAICVLICLTAAVVDGVASHLIGQTDFPMCRHTTVQLNSPCSNADCSPLVFPPNTCYCCYLLDIMVDHCYVPLLLGLQPYFTRVHSCMDIAVKLRVMLSILTVFHVTAVILCFISMFKTSPLLFYYKVARRERYQARVAGAATTGGDLKIDLQDERVVGMVVEEDNLLEEDYHSDSSEL